VDLVSSQSMFFFDIDQKHWRLASPSKYEQLWNWATCLIIRFEFLKLGWQRFLCGCNPMLAHKIQFVVLWQARTSHPVSGCCLGPTTCVQPWSLSTFGWTPGSLVVTSHRLRWTSWLQLSGEGILLHRLLSPHLLSESLDFNKGATPHTSFTPTLTLFPFPLLCVSFHWNRTWPASGAVWVRLDPNTYRQLRMLEHHIASPGSCGRRMDLNTCQIDCQKDCQVECQNMCHIECQIECLIECGNLCQIERPTECLIENLC